MGDATASPSSEKWVHLYQQAKIHGQATPSFGFSDATIVATSGASDFTDPTSSITSGTGDQRLKTITRSLELRRRHRQPSSMPALLILEPCHKGPINLSFGLESARYHSFATAETQPYGNSYYHRPSSQMQQSRRNVQQLHQDQGCTVSLDNLGPRSEMPADCGLFSMDDNIAFQELANESFSDENMNNLDWL
ncbi:VQ motif-containing protein [Salix suchowensis]|nr:VQ motif-containing protein [Salix suchowensis]